MKEQERERRGKKEEVKAWVPRGARVGQRIRPGRGDRQGLQIRDSHTVRNGISWDLGNT